MNIIGVSAFFHDASVCLVQDGKLTFAASEERYTRIKHDPRFPVEAFRRCLLDSRLCPEDIFCVAYYEDPQTKASRQLATALQKERPLDDLPRIAPWRVADQVRLGFGYEGPLRCYPHHASHAASAYFFSGFDRAAVLVVDAVGEWASTSYWLAAGAELKLLEEVRFPDSIGMVYSALTAYLGFEVNEGEYKVMGLAPYGRPCLVDAVRELLRDGSGGSYSVNLDHLPYDRSDQIFKDSLGRLFGVPARHPNAPIESVHADIAASLQVVLEEILLNKVGYLHRITGCENLCMAGGVALNCVANSRIRHESPFRGLFIQPAANDAGGALGAAALAHVEFTGQPPRGGRQRQTYLGSREPPDDIERMLRAAGVRYSRFAGRQDDLAESVAQSLKNGAIVGWYQGRMEFGPRALGARSILADPRRPHMKNRINEAVKLRESFRPFAPAVLEEEAGRFFDVSEGPLPFMLETVPVKAGADLPAITHIDGSARLQTVDGRDHPGFASLLAAFNRLTGCGVLLNTSFNQRGEPIVCTAFDAFFCFLRARLDVLVLEDIVVERTAIPREWLDAVGRSRLHETTGITHSTYTLL
jgi:carbamoyltransferase